MEAGIQVGSGDIAELIDCYISKFEKIKPLRFGIC